MMPRYRVDAFFRGSPSRRSEVITADASDTAIHDRAERCPDADRFTAEEIPPLRDLLFSHEGMTEPAPESEIRRYLVAVRDFMRQRAEAGELPSHTLGARNGAWAHLLMDRLIEVTDDAERCRRETKRLEETIEDVQP